MNAFQSPEPQQSPRPRSRKRRHSVPHAQHQTLVTEASIKIMVHSLLSIAAITSIAKLVPLNLNYQAKIHELRNAITDSQVRVKELNQDLIQYFDTRQTETFRKQYSIKMEPNERLVYWQIQEKINQSE